MSIKRLYIPLLIIPILFSCHSKRTIEYKTIKIFDKDVTLKNPIYKEDNVLYADVEEISKYFKGRATFSENGKVSMVEYNFGLVTFEKDRDIAVKSINATGECFSITLSRKVNGKKDGLDIPINDYVNLLDYRYRIIDGNYIISEN